MNAVREARKDVTQRWWQAAACG